jgi:putative transposase
VIHAQTQLQGSLGIELMCRLADISRAGYYRHWSASRPAQEETALRDEIQRLSLEQRFYGYRRITALLRQAGWSVNHKRVQRIRQSDNLLCVTGRTFRPATTDSRHRFRVYPNLARRMTPMAPNQLWVADITYVRLGEAFVYLAVILDAFSRKVVGWSMQDHLEASLALEALQMALESRRFGRGELVHHSDRGTQYACGDYIDRLEAAGVLPSMSRAGCPYDNAMAEIGQFIETIYNRQRLHSALDYLSPEEFETEAERRWTASPQPTAPWTASPGPTATTTTVP